MEKQKSYDAIIVVKDVNRISEDEQQLISALREFGFSIKILSFVDVSVNGVPDTLKWCKFVTALTDNEYIAHLSYYYGNSLIVYKEPSAEAKDTMLKTGGIWVKSIYDAMDHIMFG